MAGHYERTQPGYRDNLDPWQQQALFDLWTRFFRLCRIPQSTQASEEDLKPNSSPWKASLPSDAGSYSSRKGKHMSVDSALSPTGEHPFPELRNSQSASSQQAAGGSADTPPKDDAVKAQVQGQQELKEMRNFLHKYGGQRLRKVFWQMVKGEHPDAIMLRCLRARKWDIDRALAILGAIAAWRVEEKVEEIAQGGEARLAQTRGGINVHQNGIAYAHGAAVNGEPIYIIEVGRHYSSSQTQEELKRKIILDLETLASLMPPPVERKVVIFNMHNFSLRNMDYWCVFYLVKSMQKYPETLARVYVHAAPWIFKPVWAILKPLLDPVVREKIRLTSDIKELEEYIPLDHLPKESMKGEMDWAFEWVPPVEGENEVQLDTAARDALQEEYFTICFQIERATREVSRCLKKFQAEREEAQAGSASTSATGRGRYDRHHPPPQQDSDDASSFVGGVEWDEPAELASLKAKRDVLATKLRVIWLQLRPYMTGKVVQTRWDVIQPDGTIVWRYPKLNGTVEEQRFGEETSLPALARNLDAIRQSMDETSAVKEPSPPQVRKNQKTSEQQPSGNRSATGTAAPALSYAGVPSAAAVPSAASNSVPTVPAEAGSTQGPAPLTEENLSYIDGGGKVDGVPGRLPVNGAVNGHSTIPSAPVVTPPAVDGDRLGPSKTTAATDADSTAPLPPSSVRAEGSMSSGDTLRAGLTGGPLLPLSENKSGVDGTASAAGASDVSAVSSLDEEEQEKRLAELRRSLESTVPVHPLSKSR